MIALLRFTPAAAGNDADPAAINAFVPKQLGMKSGATAAGFFMGFL